MTFVTRALFEGLLSEARPVTMQNTVDVLRPARALSPRFVSWPTYLSSFSSPELPSQDFRAAIRKLGDLRKENRIPEDVFIDLVYFLSLAFVEAEVNKRLAKSIDDKLSDLLERVHEFPL